MCALEPPRRESNELKTKVLLWQKCRLPHDLALMEPVASFLNVRGRVNCRAPGPESTRRLHVFITNKINNDSVFIYTIFILCLFVNLGHCDIHIDICLA